MDIIPVIDIMAGQVVHALQGRRECYRPLRSLLCSDADPVSVIEGLLRLHAFQTFYLADLDALSGHPAQSEIVKTLLSAFPQVHFWLDQGIPVMTADRVIPVIGSESLGDASLSMLEPAGTGHLLSLDFRDGVFLGPSSLLQSRHLWPSRVILMNLSCVGSGGGPDYLGLGALMDAGPSFHFVAAGGVRDEQDLIRLRNMGVSATLVASALHSGTITKSALEGFLAGSEPK